MHTRAVLDSFLVEIISSNLNYFFHVVYHVCAFITRRMIGWILCTRWPITKSRWLNSAISSTATTFLSILLISFSIPWKAKAKKKHPTVIVEMKELIMNFKHNCIKRHTSGTTKLSFVPYNKCTLVRTFDRLYSGGFVRLYSRIFLNGP